MRKLLAWINDSVVGELSEEAGIWSFSYSPQWLASKAAYPLSPSLPLHPDPHLDGSSVRPVQWYFDNLLPEENARTLLARDARLDGNDAFALLAYYGSESAGSLTLLAPDVSRTAGGEVLLPDAQLQERIASLPAVSLNAESPKRMSLAGAQHKLPVIYRDGCLYEPAGDTPSTHILKPNHGSDDFRDSVINEYFCMKLADACGLPVPAVHRRYVPAPVYLIDRFDRSSHGRRLHSIDACQLLNFDRQFKYSAASMERLAVLAGACSVPVSARLRLYNWFVFNLLIGNNDAHLKNLSFMADATGITLAPHYDMLSTVVYHTKALGKDIWPDSPLTWPFCGCERVSDVTRASVIAAAGELGVPPNVASRMLDVQLRQVPLAAQKIMAQLEAENAVLSDTRKELALVFGSEMRTVRTIVYLVIADMVAALKA